MRFNLKNLIVPLTILFTLSYVYAECPPGYTLMGIDSAGNEHCEKPSGAQKLHDNIVQAGMAAHDAYQTANDLNNAYNILKDPTVDPGTRTDAAFSIAEGITGFAAAFSHPTETEVIVRKPAEPQKLPAFDLGSMTGPNQYGDNVQDSPYLGQYFEPQQDGRYVYVPPPPPAPAPIEIDHPNGNQDIVIKPEPAPETPAPSTPKSSPHAVAKPNQTTTTQEPALADSDVIRKIIQKCGARDIICQKREMAALKH